MADDPRSVSANIRATQSVESRMTGLDQVLANLDKYYQGTLRKAAVAMQEIAVLLEDYAKANHPWKDDTGATATSIIGFISEVTPMTITATLSAGMAYDVFLELCHEGRWAWLWPAIEANLPLIKLKMDAIVASDYNLGLMRRATGL